ncbi:hypothetical protein TSAR_005110 [Trichomalopsis sarcophagae]|uniref:Uncharacterized protein n=1 Tax=Trichomalopsis sarcophagae TaxID=543379 RepID=A0A232F3C3_9HYME|nr:hypothetical protein TSAR_005110 [Trichomalopsis sarcophagae]
MSASRKKKYFFDKNVPLTKYVKRKLRKIVKRRKDQITHRKLFNNNLDCETDNNVLSNLPVLETSQDLLHDQITHRKLYNNNLVCETDNNVLSNMPVLGTSQDLLHDNEKLSENSSYYNFESVDYNKLYKMIN